MTRTFANVATSDAYGTDATLALSGGRLSGFASASAFRQVSNAANLGPVSPPGRTLDGPNECSFRVSSTFDVQTLLSYQAPMTVEQAASPAGHVHSCGAQEAQQRSHERDAALIDPSIRRAKLHDDRSALLSGFGPPPRHSGIAAQHQLDVGRPQHHGATT